MEGKMMKKRELFLKRILCVFAAWAFFGLLYPEIVFTKDTCRVISADGQEMVCEVPEGSELYYRLLSAKPDEIKAKSRILELISQFFCE